MAPPETETAIISPELFALLVCPVDHESLRIDGRELVCTICGRRYPVNDGVPNMITPEDR